MGANYKRLVSLYEHYDVKRADEIVREQLTSGDVSHKNLTLAELFIECFGWHEYRVRAADPIGGPQRYPVHALCEQRLQEAEGAVSTNAFLNITGQIAYSAVLEAYNLEQTVFMDLIPEIPTSFLEGEKLPGITQIGDEIQVRNEGDPYALAGVGEDWIFTPPVRDRGLEIDVTWEAVFSDRTGGKVLERCKDVGKWSRLNREKRAIDCVVDENTTAHRYNWRGTVIASYGDNSGSHTWDNLAASNGLADWTDVDAAEQVFNAIVDPYTAEELEIEPKHLVVTKQNEQTARRVLRAGEIRVTTPGYATSGNPTQTRVDNPYSQKYQLVTSRKLASRLATDTDWFLGDLGAYAAYMVAEKMDVVPLPTGSMDEFRRRVVAGWRVSERGAYVVRQPRAVVKSTA